MGKLLSKFLRSCVPQLIEENEPSPKLCRPHGFVVVLFLVFFGLIVAVRVASADTQTKAFSQSAIELVEKKIREKPDPRGYLTLGIMHERNGDMNSAIEAYKNSVKLDPSYANGHQALGMLYGRLNRSNESAEAFQKALAIKPNDGELLNNLAATYQLQNKFDLAIDTFKKAIAQDPSKLDRRMRLAQAYMLAGHVGEATQTYEEVLKINPDVVAARHNLIALYEKNGEIDKAKEHRDWAAKNGNSTGKMVEGFKAEFDRMGYPAQVTQKGRIIEVKPTYYEKGKIPATALETKIMDEYTEAISKATNASTSFEERSKIQNAITRETAKKYHMTDENFMYLFLKISRGEKTPTSYVPPKE